MKQKTLGFDFEIITVNQAQSLAIAGRGAYSELIQFVLDKIPTLDATQAFVFGKHGTAVDKKTVRGICTAINAAIKRSGQDWRITYSSSRRAFVCFPFKPRIYSLKKRPLETRINKPTEPMILEHMAGKAGRLFEINPLDLKGKLLQRNLQMIRKAIEIIAVERYRMSYSEVAKFFGVSKDAVGYNMHHKGKEKEYQAKIEKAL